MTNLMDGRSFGACENQCYDWFQDCKDVDDDHHGDAGCLWSLGVCLKRCRGSYIAARPISQNIPEMSATHIVKSKVFFNIFNGIH